MIFSNTHEAMSKPPPAFAFQKPFPLGEDTTGYKKLTGEFVSVGEFDGKPVLKIEPAALTYLAVSYTHLTLPTIYSV